MNATRLGSLDSLLSLGTLLLAGNVVRKFIAHVPLHLACVGSLDKVTH